MCSRSFKDKELRDCFDAMDTDGSGFICKKELKVAFEKLEVPAAEIQDLLDVSTHALSVVILLRNMLILFY